MKIFYRSVNEYKREKKITYHKASKAVKSGILDLHYFWTTSRWTPKKMYVDVNALLDYYLLKKYKFTVKTLDDLQQESSEKQATENKITKGLQVKWVSKASSII